MDHNIYKKNQRKLWTSIIRTVAIAVAIGVLLILLVDTGILDRQYKNLLPQLGYYVILAVSLNLVSGFLGELTLGHAAFMSCGAYISSLITLNLDLGWFPTIIIAMLVGGIVAAVVGFVFRMAVLRLSGDYLAIVTLALGEIIKSIFNSLTDITGGPQGLRNDTYYTNKNHYLFIYIIVVLCVIFMSSLIRTRLGRAIRSVRDNEIAAEATGIPVNKIKVITFVISAFFAGVAGVIYAHNLNIIKPNYFDYNMSINILLIAVLGGLGSITGSIISVIVIVLLPEVLRVIGDYRMLIYSMALIIIMIFNNSALKKRLVDSGKLPSFSKLKKKKEEA